MVPAFRINISPPPLGGYKEDSTFEKIPHRLVSMALVQKKAITSQFLDDFSEKLKTVASCASNSTDLLRKAFQQDETNLQQDIMQYRRYLYTEGVQYGTKIYPDTLDLVSGVRDTLDNYLYLDFDDFLEVVEDVREECRALSLKAKKVQIAHTYILLNLKHLENEMEKAAGNLNTEAEKLLAKANKNRKKANVIQVSTRLGSFVIMADGGFSAAAIALLGNYWANRVKKNAMLAEGRAAAANQNVALLDQLINSLADLVKVIDFVAQFVTLIYDELTSTARIGNDTVFKKAHFKIIKGKAQSLVEGCKRFIREQPRVKSDLLSIKERLDSDYIKEWDQGLEKLQKETVYEL